MAEQENPADEVRTEVRTLIEVMIMALTATSTAFRTQSIAPSFQAGMRLSVSRSLKLIAAGAPRHPDDVALDRKIGSTAGCVRKRA
jgi:hypothetical protein